MKKILKVLCALAGLHVGACAQGNVKNLSVEEFAKYIEQKDIQLLDVRTADEFAEGFIPSRNGGLCLHADMQKSSFIEEAARLLDKSKPVAVYCRRGRRSANAAKQLDQAGYQVINLKGGIEAWKSAGKKVATSQQALDSASPSGKQTSEVKEAATTYQEGPYTVDVFRTASGKELKFHCLVHASIRIQYDGKEIQIDPVSKMGQKVIDYASMPKADYIFVTHEHGDHFDKSALATLRSSQTRLVTNQRCADMLGTGEAMKNGDSKQIADGISVEAVPAYNNTEGHLQFHPKGRDNGYVITIDGLRIYIAGDTEDIEEMAKLKDIDIAFLPCNQPYTMTPDQLVRAAKMVKPRVLFPYHYGSTDVSTLPALLKDEGIDVRIRDYQ